MSTDDATRWDDVHQQRDAPVPRPPDALAAASVDLPAYGRVLDIACGSGAVSAWLALQGLDVVGIDVSPVAIELATRLESELRNDPSDQGDPGSGALGSLDFGVVDLDNGLPAGSFDVVVCQRFRDPALYPSMVDALAPGGLLIVTVLSVVEHEGDPGPFRAVPGELVEAFGPHVDVLWSQEAGGQAHLVGRSRS